MTLSFLALKMHGYPNLAILSEGQYRPLGCKVSYRCFNPRYVITEAFSSVEIALLLESDTEDLLENPDLNLCFYNIR